MKANLDNAVCPNFKTMGQYTCKCNEVLIWDKNGGELLIYKVRRDDTGSHK